MEHNIERIKKGIKMYAINPATKQSIELLKHLPPDVPDEFALIPEDKFRFSFDMAVFGDTVAFASPNNLFGIIIENRDIAEMLRNSFDLSWSEAKRLDKETRNKFLTSKNS